MKNLFVEALLHAASIFSLGMMAVALLVLRHQPIALAFGGATIALFVLTGAVR